MITYQIYFRKRAAKEYLEAITWYKARSGRAAEKFISVIQKTLHEIEQRPDKFRLIHKNFHEVKTKNFPFSIVYFIDTTKNFVIITSIFHQKRNPKIKYL